VNTLSTFFQDRLEKRCRQGNLRELKNPQNHLIDFASNDYLGLLHDGILHALIEKETRIVGLEQGNQRGYGATGSRLLTGNSQYYEELEKEIAQFHQAEAGLIFNSGYLAILGLLSAIVHPQSTVIYDIGSHASLYDALKITRVNALPFRHQDLDHFVQCLKRATGEIFVCVASIYSCDGTQSDLKKIHEYCQQVGAHLIVDEAHATGYLGELGEGAVQMVGIQSEVFARLHTFGKALGAQGSIVLGSSLLREYLINFARPLIYTTALPLNSLIAIRCAYQALQTFPECQKQLKTCIQYFIEKNQKIAFSLISSTSPIQCLKVPGNQLVRQMAEKLRQKGFNVSPLLSPTVRRGDECLRICLHAFNTFEEIDLLIEAIQNF
jgi:8-amino-7-oxononanoate synthase